MTAEPCCPWPTYCACAQRSERDDLGTWGRTTQVLELSDLPPAALPRIARDASLDLSTSGDAWELVLARLQDAALAR